MRKADKPLVWLHGEIKTPPFSAGTRRTPKSVIDMCNKPLRRYIAAVAGKETAP